LRRKYSPVKSLAESANQSSNGWVNSSTIGSLIVAPNFLGEENESYSTRKHKVGHKKNTADQIPNAMMCHLPHAILRISLYTI
jgi:hypothetical protein